MLIFFIIISAALYVGYKIDLHFHHKRLMDEPFYKERDRKAYKKAQRNLIIEMMKDDEKSGLYDTKKYQNETL